MLKRLLYVKTKSLVYQFTVDIMILVYIDYFNLGVLYMCSCLLGDISQQLLKLLLSYFKPTDVYHSSSHMIES